MPAGRSASPPAKIALQEWSSELRTSPGLGLPEALLVAAIGQEVRNGLCKAPQVGRGRRPSEQDLELLHRWQKGSFRPLSDL